MLIKRGMKVITASGDDLTDADRSKPDHDAPDCWQLCRVRKAPSGAQTARSSRTIRQARRPQSYSEAMPETVALAKQLHADGLSYRKIAAELAARGHLTGGGKPHGASAVQKMLAPLKRTRPK